jgi:hypothetical protein
MVLNGGKRNKVMEEGEKKEGKEVKIEIEDNRKNV